MHSLTWTHDASALFALAETWRYGKNAGAIVCDCPPGCPDAGDEMETWYGGHFVCESISQPLAESIIAAVRAAAGKPPAPRAEGDEGSR